MRLLLLGALLAAVPALAQTPGSCVRGTAQGDIATPDLFARVFNTGSLFFGNQSEAAYVVPRNTGNQSFFAAGLWVGGRVGGEVRTAAARYDNFEFWPGPLGQDGRPVNPADCSAFDRIYVVSPADVAAFEATGTASADLAEWPVGLGAPAVTASGQPVAVTGRAQTLDLAAGERPVLGGGPTAFWVMNDVGNVHASSGSQPLGIEVQVTAFAPETGPGIVRLSSFYRYKVVNRSAQPIDDLYVGFFADPDLGDFSDDYVGSDPERGLAYVYNAAATDAQYGIPPAFGFDVLSGTGSAMYFTNGVAGQPTSDPATKEGYYNYLQGLWSDGTVMRALGSGYDQPATAPITKFAFSGAAENRQPWSELNPGADFAANEPGDRRLVSSSERVVSLAPGASTTIDLGLLYAQGATNLESVAALRSVSDVVQFAYAGGGIFGGGPQQGTAAAPALVAPADGARFVEAPVTFEWTAVAGATRYALEVSETPDFEQSETVLAAEPSVTLPASRFRANRTAPFYWRVRTLDVTGIGAPSAARSFTAYRFEPGPLRLRSGALAIVETSGPGGAAVCDGPNAGDEGCREASANLVFGSPNSTDDYVLDITDAGQAALAATGPSEIEIRFTEQGSIAYALTPRRLFRVPFEVWDVGPVALGGANDPSDDRRLVPFLARLDANNRCRFGYDVPARNGRGPATPDVWGRLTVDGSTYADFEALAAPLVAADPDGCPDDASVTPVVNLVNQTADGARIRSVFLEQTGERSVAELAGSTVRFYTADLVVSSQSDPAVPGASALRAAFPNPARAGLTVPYTVAAAGTVRLRVVDVLGRTVAVLADGPQAAGDHEARLDVRALAAGVYALVLEAGDQRATRTVTVVR